MLTTNQSFHSKSNISGHSTKNKQLLDEFEHDIKHLLYGSEGNSKFCFPKSPDISRDKLKGNIRT